VFDPVVTESETRDHYVVYLFSSYMNRLYLSLNQGRTASHEEFSALAKAELTRRAEILKHRVPEYAEHFSVDNIDLAANGLLPGGYEAGHAFECNKSSNQVEQTTRRRTDLGLVSQVRFDQNAINQMLEDSCRKLDTLNIEG
jgi:hypothetical protein